MCKEMMGQRNKIESNLEKDLQRVLENIRNNGVLDIPAVLVNMDSLFIANREYFENQGFLYEPLTKIENGKILKDSQGCAITLDANWLLFDNKMFFEELGYYFEPETKIENGTTRYLVRMKKR